MQVLFTLMVQDIRDSRDDAPEDPTRPSAGVGHRRASIASGVFPMVDRILQARLRNDATVYVNPCMPQYT